MKRIILNLIILLFIAGTISAQTEEELLNRRKKEHERTSLSYQRRHKKSIDWDVEENTWGLAYTFSPHFPVSLSGNFTFSYFSITGEVGASCTGKKYEKDDNNKDTPLFYVMASPGFYCKYFGVHYGVGYVMCNTDYPTFIVNGIPKEYDKTLTAYFCHKPFVTGYIPISDGDYYITLNAGYMFVPKFKELNGFTCGIGFQWEL